MQLCSFSEDVKLLKTAKVGDERLISKFVECLLDFVTDTIEFGVDFCRRRLRKTAIGSRRRRV